jgi:hypothetical protein
LTLITIRPGPTVHVFRDGQEVIAVPLTNMAALSLIRDVALAIKLEKATNE